MLPFPRTRPSTDLPCETVLKFGCRESLRCTAAFQQHGCASGAGNPRTCQLNRSAGHAAHAGSRQSAVKAIAAALTKTGNNRHWNNTSISVPNAGNTANTDCRSAKQTSAVTAEKMAGTYAAPNVNKNPSLFFAASCIGLTLKPGCKKATGNRNRCTPPHRSYDSHRSYSTCTNSPMIRRSSESSGCKSITG